MYGIISRQKRKIIGFRCLLDAVAATESFLQKVTYRIYKDFEYKLETSLETSEQQAKLLTIIIDSSDRSEIIEKIAEEKIRGIFYGNPADFFEKDKARIGLNSYFKDNFKLALQEYKEIVARRNIYAHNGGRVDRKYLREVKNSPFSLGQKLSVDEAYLRKMIFLLHGFSSIVVNQVIVNTYGAISLKYRFSLYVKRFEKIYKGK